MDFNESPVNYDFFGGQPQISDQHPGMLQSLPRQQSGISDMQLLQQQLMLKQMQEMQRQQQLQKQQEARKMNSINQVSAFAKQAAVNPSQALINGIPIRETSNYSWQPELMAANTTWQQRGLSPVMQGSFRGHIFSPEQGQGTPHQVDQSLYGVPISSTRVTPSQYSPFPMDKPSMQQILDSSNSLTSNQHAGFPEQVSMQDGTLVSRQGYQGKNMIASSDGQGINTGFNLESLQQLNPQKCNGPMQELCMRQDLAGPSETSQEDTTLQVAPSLNVATLDPTEAQILFGPDDNLWDTFGRGANMGSGGYNMSDSTDFFSSLPSVQSGSWSALMQSAVAETSSGDTGLQEEWSCLNFRNSESPAKNQLTPSVIARSKQQSNWAANSLLSASSLNPQPFCPSHEINTGTSYNNIPGVQQSGVNTSHEHRERLQSVSPRRHIQQFPEDGNKWSDRNLIQKAAFEGSHFHGKAINLSDVGSWANQQSMPSYSSNDQPLNRLGKSTSGWNLMDSVPPSTTAAFKNQENENSFQDSHNVDKEVPISEVMGHGAGTWKTNSIAELEHAKSATGNPQAIPLAPPSQHLRNNISSTSVHAGRSAVGKFSAAFSPGFLYSKNYPNQDMPDTCGQTAACESVNESLDKFSSQPKQMDKSFERGQPNQSAQSSVPDTSRHTSHDDFASSAEMPQPNDDTQNHARDSAQQFPVLEAAPAPQHCSSSQDGVSSKIQPPVWTSVSKQPRPFGTQPFQIPSDMFTEPASNLTSTQKQIEAFGRFLKPNNILHQSYSLLHQSQGMRNAEADQVSRSLKRFKTPGGSVDAHLVATQGSQHIYEHSNTARDASANHTLVSPGDSKMQSLSAKTADNQDINSPSKDMIAFGQNDFQNFANSNSAVPVRDEHSQMSSQMGPSWFDRYGTFKNEQILPMHDACKDVTMKASELPFIAGRPDRLHAHSLLEQGNVVAANQFGIFQKGSISSSIGYENFSISPDSADVNVVVTRSKKRKSAIFKLVPWHKEVTLGSQRPQNLSAADVEWALAVDRLTEKVEDDLEMVDDGLPVHRSKRRLLLTTQLMQILLHPPLALILSADAILHYETAAYFISRSTLGDACCTLSCTGSDTSVPSSSRDLLPEKIKSSEKITDQYFSKVMEDLISRTKKLENDLLRLEKRASVSNLRVECQDLERFSVINRFAKFHGRDRTDGTEISSTSDAAANAYKSCLQRYVTALPMPRNLPDRVQCLSL
ncbi:hypothetical protein OIU78_016963 [Salix suchowensis]|nr:hypothetical protein OIU78_016963 [Salix suchowensis]